MDIDKLLKEAGLRLTKQRRLVLKLLMADGSPLSHNEISARLEVALDKATLYRVLDTLLAAELIHRVQGLDGVWRFCAHEHAGKEDADVGQHYRHVGDDKTFCLTGHPHFQCLECGKMSCLTDQRIQRVEVPEGATVEGKQLIVYGRCRECNKK